MVVTIRHDEKQTGQKRDRAKKRASAVLQSRQSVAEKYPQSKLATGAAAERMYLSNNTRMLLYLLRIFVLRTRFLFTGSPVCFVHNDQRPVCASDVENFRQRR